MYFKIRFLIFDRVYYVIYIVVVGVVFLVVVLLKVWFMFFKVFTLYVFWGKRKKMYIFYIIIEIWIEILGII